ncbi:MULTISPECIES: LiaI-LiaF-like domain-containing protein [unclassified Lentimicrobium]|uniref:LiaF transmembrane domain-containing protein n=1 Tax=unclassified Lentimicrobium TaxID=2677434 RepID=UPI001554632B|nr:MULTISPECIES: DUF5668 domain-containing protein [unclassified Lentimicrobium]NPD46672.1 hypothetical protein [Lentimicrobium sp. S6]NPD85497.1 hypothetical protein [Lentimicrobium sp. L6]
MENRNIFWGVLLVAVGGLFILDNMDLINFSFSALVGLWPLLLVLWGISILPMKPMYKTVGGLLIAVFALVYASTSDKTFWWQDHIINKFDKNVHMNYGNDDDEDYDDDDDTYYNFKFDEDSTSNITNAKLNMDIAAGKFRIDEATDDHIIDFDAYSNIGPYTSNMVMNGNTAEINIDLEDGVIRNGTNRNRASIKLNPKVEWDLDLDIGAADFRADFRKFRVSKLDIDGGASAIKVKIGDLQEDTFIKIDAGAASIRVDIPQEAGCLIESESFLVDMELDNFQKNGNGDYVTSNYEASEQKVRIDIDAAISKLKVGRYSK